MSKPRSIKHQARYIIDPMEAELRELRLKVEQLEDKIRAERRRSTRLEEELAFERQHQAHMARRRLNGVAA